MNLIKVMNFSGAGLRRHEARATRAADHDTRRAGHLLRPQSGAHFGRVLARHRGPHVPPLDAGRAVTKGQKGIRLVTPDTIDESGTGGSIKPVYVFDVTQTDERTPRGLVAQDRLGALPTGRPNTPQSGQRSRRIAEGIAEHLPPPLGCSDSVTCTPQAALDLLLSISSIRLGHPCDLRGIPRRIKRIGASYVVYTDRGDVRQLISVRKATADEQARYLQRYGWQDAANRE
jgi:hypothetical protein